MVRTHEIVNGRITDVTLGIEDHGILTAYIYIETAGFSGGFGGYALDTYDKQKERRVGAAGGTEYILRVLNTLEESQWEKLKGLPCRVDSEGWGGRILRIGHYMKDKWFDPEALFNEMKEAQVTD